MVNRRGLSILVRCMLQLSNSVTMCDVKYRNADISAILFKNSLYLASYNKFLLFSETLGFSLFLYVCPLKLSKKYQIHLHLSFFCFSNWLHFFSCLRNTKRRRWSILESTNFKDLPIKFIQFLIINFPVQNRIELCNCRIFEVNVVLSLKISWFADWITNWKEASSIMMMTTKMKNMMMMMTMIILGCRSVMTDTTLQGKTVNVLLWKLSVCDRSSSRKS